MLLIALRLFPTERKKAEAEILDAKKTVESGLLPKGDDVVHHTSLPPSGRSSDWILGEMAKMDVEMGHDSWREGKLSGAVYRMSKISLQDGNADNIQTAATT